MNYLIEGTDRYLVQRKIVSLHQEILDKKNIDRITTYDLSNGSIDELLASVNQLSFFDQERIIVVVGADLNLDEKDQKHNEDVERLMTYFEHPVPESSLIFDLGDYPLNTRNANGKKLQKLCRYTKIAPLDTMTFQQMTRQDLKKEKIELSETEIKTLNDRLPLDLANWHSELAKLKNYPGKLDSTTIKQLVIRPLFGSEAKDTLYFSNAILSKDLKRTLSYWQDLSQQTKEYYPLIGMIASQLRFLYEVKYLANSGHNNNQITKQLDANPYRVTKTMELVNRYRLNDIEELLVSLANLDLNIKTGVINDKLGFELFLLEAAGGLKIWNL